MPPQEYNAMIGGLLPSEVVAAEYVNAFIDLASPLLDASAVMTLNRTYHASMLFDSRRPDAAARSLGVLPNCSKCTGGLFTDNRTHERVAPNDWRFLAAHVFRFIGFALQQAGGSCPALFDPDDPTHSLYGPWNERPCAPLPPLPPRLHV